MSSWLRKVKKSKLKEKDRGIVDFAKTTPHYFKDISEQIPGKTGTMQFGKNEDRNLYNRTSEQQ